MALALDTSTTARTFAIGGDMVVNRIGYGAMRLTGQPGNFGPYADWEGGKRLLRHAVERGVNFIDTARSYGPGWSEKIIAEALYPYAPGVVIATKGGVDKRGPSEIVVDASPATLRRQVEDALKTLKVERIDLFQLHRVDPKTPLEISVQALDGMRREGLIRHIGLSNVDLDQLTRALAVAPIASVQNRFNQAERESERIVDFTAAHGIAFIPYGPLGAHPMQRGAALPPQEALAWLLKRSPNIVLIPGTTSIAHLDENLTVLEDLA